MSDKDRTREADLRQRLSEVLGIYGADPRRWPPDERDMLTSIAGEMEIAKGQADLAKAQADEERTLDRLLDLVDTPVPPDGAMERIIAAAGGSTSGEVIAFSKSGSKSPATRAGISDGGARSAFTFRPAIGLVAASLLLGLITGTSKIADPLYLRSMNTTVMEPYESEAGILGLAREDIGFEEDDL